jgi:hypothetical protein
MTSYGYARVSTLDQDLTIQRAALKAAGCTVARAEKASGARRDGRTELQVETSNYPSLRSLQSRIAASGCDVLLLARLSHRLWAAGAALRGGCGVMRAQFGC